MDMEIKVTFDEDSFKAIRELNETVGQLVEAIKGPVVFPGNFPEDLENDFTEDIVLPKKTEVSEVEKIATTSYKEQRKEFEDTIFALVQAGKTKEAKAILKKYSYTKKSDVHDSDLEAITKEMKDVLNG